MTVANQQIRELTPEEAERFDRLAALIEAEKPDIIRRAKLVIAAGAEPGFNGDLRRAIHSGHVPLENIAAAAQMKVFELCDFLEGTADLTSSQIAALVKFLELQLVRTIPATPPASRKKKPT